MKAFTLSLILLVLGVTAAAGQTVPANAVAAKAEPSPKPEPVMDAEAPVKGSTAAADERSRIATRPPTPLVSK